MNATKKSLTTLAAAAALAGGVGLAIAQTGAISSDSSTPAAGSSYSNTQSSDTQSSGAGPSSAGSATLSSSTDTSSSTTMSNTDTTTQERVAQVDRN